MREGWFQDEYLILFTEGEVVDVSQRYGIAEMLPGFQIIGFRGWDDFIVRNASGDVFTVPTVPCDAEYLAPCETILDPNRLTGDKRFEQKLKWYVKPVAFGGDPGEGPNLAWVPHDSHAELVRWWNDLYRRVRASSG